MNRLLLNVSSSYQGLPQGTAPLCGRYASTTLNTSSNQRLTQAAPRVCGDSPVKLSAPVVLGFVWVNQDSTTNYHIIPTPKILTLSPNKIIKRWQPINILSSEPKSYKMNHPVLLIVSQNTTQKHNPQLITEKPDTSGLMIKLRQRRPDNEAMKELIEGASRETRLAVTFLGQIINREFCSTRLHRHPLSDPSGLEVTVDVCSPCLGVSCRRLMVDIGNILTILLLKAVFRLFSSLELFS
ncbi:hypothetical protein J6590_030800 [Homalodisca vitripennis]|nr:hypothetical protein J6590_030800 [Homalodisca vitripennis]